MNMKKVLLAGSALVAATAAPANASIVDNPHFKVLGLVIVWGDGNVVNDFVIDSDNTAANNDADLIAGDVTPTITGSLAPAAGEGSPLSIVTRDATTGAITSVLQAGDSSGDGVMDVADTFTSFTLTADTDVAGAGSHRSVWYAASNTPFNVSAALGTPVASGGFGTDDISYDMTVSALGANATTPNGNATTGATLDAIDGTDVWAGNNLTAATAGNILSQGWQFQSDYGFDYDLSMGAGEIEVDVTFTVYVP